MKVTELKTFGVSVELPNGGHAYVHISELSHRRVNRVDDVTSIGVSLRVKLIEINDRDHSIRLTAKT